MKKIIIMLLALLTISLSACSQKKTETNMKQKVLVVYFWFIRRMRSFSHALLVF